MCMKSGCLCVYITGVCGSVCVHACMNVGHIQVCMQMCYKIKQKYNTEIPYKNILLFV